MSRNLMKTNCDVCGDDVALVEEPREITPDEAGPYYKSIRGYAHKGAIVANAACVDCGAKYLAHVDLSACEGYGRDTYFHRRKDRPFYDLSYRSTFNDEPGDGDLPVLTLRKLLSALRVRPIAKWYDLWVGVCPSARLSSGRALRGTSFASRLRRSRPRTSAGLGAYIDRENLTLYILPIPCLGIAVTIPRYLRNFRPGTLTRLIRRLEK